MKKLLKEGSLVRVTRSGSFTLCKALKTTPPSLRECPVEELEVKIHPRSSQYDDIFQNLEGKLGLIVYVIRNRLNQVVGYRILFEGHEMFCKSKVAAKYLELVETTGDESR